MKNSELSAFPLPREIGETKPYSGLSKREYFAARAMQGLISNPEHRKNYKGETYLMPLEIYAKQAVDAADALLKELEE